MKLKINVIDLDKTLLPFDSFRLLIINEIKSLNIFVILVSFFRVLRVISNVKYKEFIISYLSKSKNKNFFELFANSLFPKLNKDVINIVKRNSDEGTINILLSASPNLYVQFIINRLGWKGTGSYFNENKKFISIYGKSKIEWLEANYNCNEYFYEYAISDSNSDIQLLQKFKKYDLWILH